MELKANELRLNNLLYQWRTDIPFEVGINDLKIIQSGESKARPIPLTEEWKPKIVSWLSNDYKIEWKNNRINFYFNNGYIATCDYLHEYQNLHFALTNEELEIKM